MPQVRNLVRSAMAPEISAGVMIANISWKAENTSSGMVSTSPLVPSLSTDDPRCDHPMIPTMPLDPFPKASAHP